MRRGPIASLLALALALAACGDGPPAGTPSSAPASGASAAPAGTEGGRAEGLIVKLESEGLTRVTGFRLRAADGTELDLRIGVLENGSEFPPGHLAEHMATTSPIRAYFRDEGGARVVYRLEDAE